MSNALTMFSPGAVPAHIGSFFGDIGSNIPERTTVPSLSYEGKTWTISLDGKKTKLMGKNADGDEVPISVMRVVILNCAQRRGRQYYEGSYDPNKISPPKCWSADGITPDASIPSPQASACDKCPRSVKGSKVLDNGNTTTECSPHRMLAVIPSGKLDFTPLRLKIAITSDWDSMSPDQEAQGWFSFQKYLDFLRSHGCPHTAGIVTKIKFDPNTAYPKLFFQNERWLTPEEVEKIQDLPASPDVLKLLDGSWTPAGVDGVATGASAPAQEVTPAPAPAAKAKPKPKPAPAPVVEEVEEVEEVEAAAPPAEEDDIEVILDGSDLAPAADVAKPVKAKPAAKKEEPAPAASTNVSDDLAELLSDWT